MRLADLPAIAQLSAPEKILLAEDLWDSIASDEASVPVPQSHRDERDRRLRGYAAHPDNLLSLEELRSRIDRRR